MGLILSSLTLLSILELRFVSLLSLPPTNQFDERMLKSAIAPFTRRKFEDRCFVVMLWHSGLKYTILRPASEAQELQHPCCTMRLVQFFASMKSYCNGLCQWLQRRWEGRQSSGIRPFKPDISNHSRHQVPIVFKTLNLFPSCFSRLFSINFVLRSTSQVWSILVQRSKALLRFFFLLDKWKECLVDILDSARNGKLRICLLTLDHAVYQKFWLLKSRLIHHRLWRLLYRSPIDP